MWVRSACLRYHDQPVPRANLTLTFRGLCQVSESDGIDPVEALLLSWMDQGPCSAQGDFHVETLAPGCKRVHFQRLSVRDQSSRKAKKIYCYCCSCLQKKIPATPKQMNQTTPTKKLTGILPALLAEEQLQCFTYSYTSVCSFFLHLVWLQYRL